MKSLKFKFVCFQKMFLYIIKSLKFDPVDQTRTFRFIKATTILLAKTIETSSKQMDLVAELIRFCLNLMTNYQRSLRQVTQLPNMISNNDEDRSKRINLMNELKNFF